MGTLSNNQVTSLLSLGADAMDNMFDILIEPPEGLKTFENYEGNRHGLPAFSNADFKNDITIRADGFSPPVFKIKTYPVKYKTIEIERPATSIEGPRQFDISFRLDANYQAYRFLGAWKSILMQASTGYATNALYGDGGKTGNGSPVGDINNAFGRVVVGAMSRPIHQVANDPFKAHGVTAGKFVDGTSLVSEPLTKPGDSEMTKWVFEQVWLAELDEPQFKTEGGGIMTIKATFKFGNFTDPIYNEYGKN